ncbi:MAG: hypothetical protein ACHQF2_10070 [Flavobacteriales bacterium]
MNIIDFLFQCGIIYIVFSFIWSFFMFLYNMATQFRKKSTVETYVFKFLNTYVLISLMALLTSRFMLMPHHSPGLYATVGLLTMYSYLIGRLERNRMVVQLNNNVMRLGASEINMRMEKLLIPASLLYFVLCLVEPKIAINPVNNWFQHSIGQLYDTPVIGWIFAFVGILMLIGLLIRSLFFTSLFLNKLTNRSQGRGPSSGSGNKKDDDFSDYEIMD